jgi:hypothetical protein
MISISSPSLHDAALDTTSNHGAARSGDGEGVFYSGHQEAVQLTAGWQDVVVEASAKVS